MKIYLLLLMFGISSAIAEGRPEHAPLPPDASKSFADFEKQIPQRGLITEENTAKAIGRAILEAEFGGASIAKAGPLEAYRESGYWIVQTVPPKSLIGAAGGYLAVISQRDGRILYLTQGK